MELHSVELTRRILIGNDVLGKVPQVCKELNLKGPVLLLTGPNTKRIAGNAVRDYMEDEGFVTDKVIVRDSMDERNFEKSSPRFLVGVGSGKVMEMAKYLSHRLDVPFISVPTAPSHDGVVSSRLTVGDTTQSYNGPTPLSIIADISIIRDAPEHLISSGCGDLMANVTAVEDWKLGSKEKGEYYSEYAAALSLLAVETLIHSTLLIKERKERGMKNLMEALITSAIAMNVVGSSRPCSGAEHNLYHYLVSKGCEAAHGDICSVGTIFSAYLHGLDWKGIRKTLEGIGTAVTASEIGIDEDGIVEALSNCHTVRDRWTVLRNGVPESDVRRICKETGII
ncbi:MAG: NAD(P)-dependent glycerol-1-phosphate dehydrogenase [Candidatus Aenigmatarchaeota archaeon]|nr:MAG: NAD(P)-dependent glycerol-1-phosphate dehydrogenase [Candidatus Aenigmarchaeota archaeon]